jgi:hypothetical protein
VLYAAQIFPHLVDGVGPAEPGAAQLLERINREGGDRVIRQLWAEDELFEKLCEKTSTGEPPWLKVAARLRPFSDAGASLSLDISVARALPRQPAGVLTMIAPPWQLAMICGAPFIEEPVEETRAYLVRTISALSKPMSRDLEEKRVACLYHLHTEQKRIQPP